VQVGRNFLEPQVVILVAVGAAHLVKVPPSRLLGRKRRCRMAACQAEHSSETDCCPSVSF
jgi:hypothetical protein